MAWSRQRRFPRFAPKDLTFAVLHQTCSKVGPIVSISKGGLAFEYVPLDEFEESRKKSGAPSIDIIVGEAPLFLSRIPCEVLYDFTVDDETFLSREVGKRCCGLRFGDLDEEQNRGLDIFLQGFVADNEETQRV